MPKSPHERGGRLRQIGPIGLRPALPAASVSPVVTAHMWQELDYRIDACWATNVSDTKLHWVGKSNMKVNL
jgi:hypothetical protein